MRTKEKIMEGLDVRPDGDSYRSSEDVSSRALEAIVELLADIRDRLPAKGIKED